MEYTKENTEQPIREHRVQIPGDDRERRLQVLSEMEDGSPDAARSTALRVLGELLAQGTRFSVRHQIHPDGKADDPRPYALLLVVAYPEDDEH